MPTSKEFAIRMEDRPGTLGNVCRCCRRSLKLRCGICCGLLLAGILSRWRRYPFQQAECHFCSGAAGA